MSIRINKNKCVGCKRCLDVCPGSLIKTDATGKAYIKYPKDCWGCTSCLKECKTGAIAFFLGADIGGMGSEMTVNESKDTILWKIKKYTGLIFQNQHTFASLLVPLNISVPFLLAILPVYNFHCPVDYLSDLRDRCMYMDNRRTILLAL